MGNTRDQYLKYAKKIVSVLSDEAFYTQYKNKVESGASNVKMYKKRLIQDISIDWIETIEGVLPNLDAIVRNPRRFIVQEEDIVDVSLARSISTESVKHLAQHTNMISKVDKDGSVTPSKILNITKEESFEIYENRFLYTLLLKLKDFVTMRYDKIKKASATQEVLQLDVESRFNLPAKKVSYRTEYMAQLSFDEVMQLDPETLTKIERVAKIDRIVTDFLSSSFAKAMRSCAPVRPPITRTNVILKEPNFKKALTLWQFIETYQVTGGFATSDEIEDCELEKDSVADLRDMVALNTMIFESLYDHDDAEVKMDDKEFTDVMRVGELDFLPDKVLRDPWAQKMMDKEKVEEDEKEKEVEKEKSEELEALGEEKHEEKPDEKEDKEDKKEEQDETDKKEKEKEEGDEENERERQTETPPRDWEDEEDDDEPNEEKFDKNLFEVKMLYKRPKDDKLRQEEIGRIKDAIDRCLGLYRKQKQNEADEELQEKKRKHIQERVEALRKQREAEMLTRSVSDVLGDSFASQAAKIVLPKKDEAQLENDTVDSLEQKVDEVQKEKGKIKFGSLSLNEQKLDTAFDFNLQKQLEELSGVKVPKEKTAKKVEKTTAESNIEPQTEKSAVKSLSKTTLNQQYSKAKGIGLKIGTIDEGALNIGKAPLKFTSASELLSGTFGEQKAKINLPPKKISEIKAEKELVQDIIASEIDKPKEKKVAKPKSEVQNAEGESKKSAALKEKKASQNETKDDGQISFMQAAEEKSKGKLNFSDNRDPWALSSTTLNQKYSQASGKSLNFEKVDEKKIAVGKITLKQKSVNDVLSGDVFGGKAEIKPAKKKPDKDDSKKK